MKKGSGGGITSLLLEEKGGWEGGRKDGGREGGSVMRLEMLRIRRRRRDPADGRRERSVGADQHGAERPGPAR